ncbi:HPr family phosphocarrier protein [bacterium]|nr:HPr family phosphocarrier protein [bacterium]
MTDAVTQSVTVPGENGLHLVPCSLIAQSASAFDCDVRISKGTHSVDAKNIFDLMSLNAGHGSELVLEAAGASARDAVDALVALFESGFNGHASRSAAQESH